MEEKKSIIDITDIRTLQQWAEQFPSQYPAPLVALLDGPLGSGKTQLVRFITNALEGCSEVCSPSFSIHNSYLCGNGMVVDHFDLFRLNNNMELDAVGLWDALSSQQAEYIFIEWPQRLRIQDLCHDWHILNLRIDYHGGQRILHIAKIR